MNETHRPAILGKRYVVSSTHYLASMGGLRILEQGGNAADAGVATGVCINMVPKRSRAVIHASGEAGVTERRMPRGRSPLVCCLK